MKILKESWDSSGCRTPVQDEVNSVTPGLTSYSYDNQFQSNITDSQHSLHTLHENFEIPTLNQTYLNTSVHSSQNTENFNHTPYNIVSPSSKSQKSKYRKRTIPPKLTARSKSSIKLVTPADFKHSVTNNNKSSTESTLNTQLNLDSNNFSTLKTVCHCDDPNFKLFREIQLDSHPILIKNNDKLVFFITPDLQICRFQ